MKAARWLLLIAAICVIVGITFNNIHKAKSAEAPANAAPGYIISAQVANQDGDVKSLTWRPGPAGEPQVFDTKEACDTFVKDQPDPVFKRDNATLAMIVARHGGTLTIVCESRADVPVARGGLKQDL